MPPKRNRLKRGKYSGIVFVLLVLFLGGGYWFLTAVRPEKTPEDNEKPVVLHPDQPGRLIEKSDVHILLGNTRLVNLKEPIFQVHFDGRSYEVATSLHEGLQRYLLKKMDRVNSRYIGIVAMEPDTGRLLAMAGFNKIDADQDPCLTADYPALARD